MVIILNRSFKTTSCLPQSVYSLFPRSRVRLSLLLAAREAREAHIQHSTAIFVLIIQVQSFSLALFLTLHLTPLLFKFGGRTGEFEDESGSSGSFVELESKNSFSFFDLVKNQKRVFQFQVNENGQRAPFVNVDSY